jgi:hypothetical protein
MAIIPLVYHLFAWKLHAGYFSLLIPGYKVHVFPL